MCGLKCGHYTIMVIQRVTILSFIIVNIIPNRDLMYSGNKVVRSP